MSASRSADGSPVHLLGTDTLGRDILSRGIVGSRISLALALSSIALITVIGTLTGIARALKPRRPGLRIVGVEPAESAVLSGDEPGPHDIQGIGAGFCPSVLNLAALDAVERVSERDALAAARRCAAQAN